ncbi:STAG-domain-containing protein [Polychaeton citri CBS 116435]|uniref:STAG-domain-containing protein n=1 Tax=Polychaeton citri CBS 116435 TaxID=1314669 RepID=A0A9P4QF29_9PEZI|nr:STAG-domain-containing protein [Polychaeton citri CBS 116435]
MSSPSADGAEETTIRRSSGRVRRQPDSIYRAAAANGSGKRKRNAEDDVEMVDGSDDDEDDEDDASSSEEDEPDEEELREQSKKKRQARSRQTGRKPAQKKAKVNGITSLPIRPAATTAAGPRKRAPKKAKALDSMDAQEAGGLFAKVFAEGRDMKQVASGWLKAFELHESSALADVINFVLKSAGCSSKLSEHDIEDPDGATNRLSDVQDEYQATNPSDYPFITKGKSGASFKESAASFMEVLIRTIAAAGLLVSQSELLENIQVWLSTMSSAANRSFRHTSTVFSLSVITALCEVAKENAQETATKRRHAESEKKVARPNKARVKNLEQQAKEKHETQEFLESLLRDWFDTIFIHRYRDIDPLIRCDCVKALGDWIMIMPDVFFDGNHLRYMGWLLSDDTATTRAEVVKQLHRFYVNEDMIGGLKAYTERFRARMVEIATSDAESNVRADGVELLNELRANGLLEPDDIDAVGRLVYDSDVKVRKAVGEFVAENIKDTYGDKVDDLGGLETLEEALPDADESSFEAPRVEWLKFKSLAEILAAYDDTDDTPNNIQKAGPGGGMMLYASGVESRFSLAAQTLYDNVDEVQEWQMLAGFLLFDNSSSRKSNGVASDPVAQLKHECQLSDAEQTILLEVLNASVKRHLVDLAEKSVSTKAKLTKKQREEMREEEEETARQLASLIPKLLRKFGDESSSAAAVLRLEGVLSLPSLHELRRDSATIAGLLDDIKKQFMAHGTDEVLGAASSAILHAKSYGDLDEVTDEKVAGLWEDVIGNLSQLLNPATVLVRGAASQEELAALSNNLLRIIRLSQVSDCSAALEDDALTSSDSETGTEFKAGIDFLVGLIQRAVPTSGPSLSSEEALLEDTVASRAAEASLLYILWKFKSIKDIVTSSRSGSDSISDDQLEALALRRDTFVNNLLLVLNSRKAGEDISYQTANTLLDLYSSAAVLTTLKPRQASEEDEDAYTVLYMKFNTPTQKTLMKIFTALEGKFAVLAGKRQLDRADPDEEVFDDDPESDSESDDDMDDDAGTQTQAAQHRRERKMLNSLLTEQKLCIFTGKLVHAAAAEVLDVEALRKRLDRNKTKLGANYKEVVAYLDADKAQQKKKGRSKASIKATTPAAAANGPQQRSGRKTAKSSAIVAEDEMDDEIEDDEDDGEEALRRKELVVEEDDEQEAEHQGADDDDEEEEESVVGD